MLLNAQGKTATVPTTLTQRRQEQLLTPLREVLTPESYKCGILFQMGTRAKLYSQAKPT